MKRARKPKALDPIHVNIRWMIRRDMPEVLDIEKCSFASPWDEEDFLRFLRQRNCIGMVAEIGEIVVGYMIYELEKHKLHIANFAVSPTHRRRDVGTQMSLKLTGKLSAHRRTRITLDVIETNLDALLFWKSQGYLAYGVRRGFYPEGIDAIRMEYRLDGFSPVNRVAIYKGEAL